MDSPVTPFNRNTPLISTQALKGNVDNKKPSINKKNCCRNLNLHLDANADEETHLQMETLSPSTPSTLTTAHFVGDSHGRCIAQLAREECNVSLTSDIKPGAKFNEEVQGIEQLSGY